MNKEEMEKKINEGNVDKVALQVLKQDRLESIILGEKTLAKMIMDDIPISKMKHNKLSSKEANLAVQSIITTCNFVLDMNEKQMIDVIEKGEENKNG